MATLAAREAGWCSKAAQWRSSGPSLAGLWELGGPPVGPPHTQAAAPGASLTLGTLTTNVLQERKPSFPDLTPCDLRPRFLKGSGARQVREGRGHHFSGRIFQSAAVLQGQALGHSSPPSLDVHKERHRRLRQLPHPAQAARTLDVSAVPLRLFFFLIRR